MRTITKVCKRKVIANTKKFKKMQNYLLTILINNKVDEKARALIIDSLTKDLGSNTNQEVWGVRGLAYEIAHQDKAFYVHFSFQTEPANIPAIDRKLKLNEEIIRYLLIKEELKKTKAKKNIIKKTEEKAEVVESAIEAEDPEIEIEERTPTKAKKTAKK